MKIVLDRNIRAAGRVFDHHGEVVRLDGRHISADDVQDASALIVRSVTRVGRDLLRESRVQFVGTTTIGTDHLDIPWLESRGVRWASAPGCNADAAAQYTVAMISLACQRLGRPLAGQRAGIIGRGHVGSRVARMLRCLGMTVRANDPPLADSGVTGLCSLEEALASDVVCLHTPLSHAGPYPTHHLISARELDLAPPGSLLVNTARGDVVDAAALKAALISGRLHAALDVWPGEPCIDAELLRLSVVATPHVAGYSDDGRRQGVLQVYRAFCDWFGFEASKADAPDGGTRLLTLDPQDQSLGTILDQCCFVAQHDAAMRALGRLSADRRAAGFDRLRREYPSRRDFRYWRIAGAGLEIERTCRNLGFSIEAPGAHSP
jgi:erythronate-4-phosphate dehydrogenase